jgi:hypothetical protein
MDHHGRSTDKTESDDFKYSDLIDKFLSNNNL